MKGLLVLVLLGVVLSVTAQPSQLTYTIGTQYVYAVSGVVDARGSDVTSGDRTQGSLGYLTSTMVMEPVSQDNTSYTFVMNMFNTVVNVAQGSSEPLTDNPQPMGYDMYFQQSYTGQVMQIWYNTADSPYYVNVKIASINSFQTSMVSAGETKTISESDPVGVHTANVVGAAGNSAPLLIAKSFTQTDVSQFADPTLTSNNVVINAQAAVGVHQEGYVVSTSVTQMSVLTNINSVSSTRRDLTNSTGFDMDLSSQGNLTHVLTGTQPSNTVALKRTIPDNYAKSTMFETAVKTGAAAIIESYNIADVKTKLTASLEFPTFTEEIVKLLFKVGRHMRYFAEDAHFLLPHLTDSKLYQDAIFRDKVFYVLGVSQNEEYLVKYGLNSIHSDVFDRAVMACAAIEAPSATFMTQMETFARKPIAIHVYGILAGRQSDPQHGLLIVKFIASNYGSMDVIPWINAFGNAGPTAISLKLVDSAIFTNENANIRAAAVFALRKFASDEYAHQLARTTCRSATEKLVLNSCAKVLSGSDYVITAGDSDFPFNKSISEDVKLGGKVVSADFTSELFAGTNFNCNQPDFNYEALATAQATASLFGESKQAFDAQAIYGKDNGQALADSISLTVWGNVIYNQLIPELDCQPHTYPLGQTAPGFQVSHTLWVSIVPVVFTAGVSLQLDLSWGWQICDAQLSAQVSLIPAGTLVVSGDITVDLLLLRAGLNLATSFTNERLIPTLYIHGSECEIGFDIEEDADPMAGQFDSYYQWRQCKYWVFDCTWGNHNQQNWWAWTRPATERVVFNQAWKISP